ncbi:dual specificity protein phosphatase family protein [Microbacterium testaceum]|uniref:dual specificity protein phosphatase family protein n=1 Tax=Microbacterium testaceum TaxID=2033 RepID=UPI0022E29653|nr:dual specificity protein phosphatase [Microbacterium testaceum]
MNELKWADACRLTDQLWVGSELDQTDKERAYLQLNELTISAGINSFIDCRYDSDDIDWVTGNAPQVDYLHLGVEDTGLWMPDGWFDEGVDFALDQIANSGVVFAHCQAGINRGPSMAYAILLAQGWDAVEALDHIRTARPEARVGYAEDAVLWASLHAGADADEAKQQMNRVRQWRAKAGLPRRSEEQYGETR